MLTKGYNLKKIIIFLMLGILIIIIHLKYDVGVPCIFFKITGLYCPGCGITRAIFSLMKFDIYQAFRYNMLIIILLPFAISYYIYIFIFKGKKRIPKKVLNFLLIITILFGILRNIPEFEFLMPTKIH